MREGVRSYLTSQGSILVVGEAADDAEALGWFRLEDIETVPALPAVGTLILQALEAA